MVTANNSKIGSVFGNQDNTQAKAKTAGTAKSATPATPVTTTPVSSAGYSPAQSVTNLFQRLNNQPADFSYGKQADLDAMYDKVMNRPDFKFDLAGDTLYRQYADQYANMGRQASLDTMGQAAALTGGYGNSYGASAGNQAYQQYLGQLNNAVMDVYDRQHQHYEDELQNDMNRYSLGLQDRGAEYDMYNQNYNNWLNENNMALSYANMAKGYVDSMLAQGKMPSADMLALVGLTPEDAQQLLVQQAAKSGGGSSKKPVSIDTGSIVRGIISGGNAAANYVANQNATQNAKQNEISLENGYGPVDPNFIEAMKKLYSK